MRPAGDQRVGGGHPRKRVRRRKAEATAGAEGPARSIQEAGLSQRERSNSAAAGKSMTQARPGGRHGGAAAGLAARLFLNPGPVTWASPLQEKSSSPS